MNKRQIALGLISFFCAGFVLGVISDAVTTPDHIEVVRTATFPDTYSPYQPYLDGFELEENQAIEDALLAKAVNVGECRITYYCVEQYEHICGLGLGITATGAEARPGVIAVDPKVIPLHSDVYINGEWYKAEDTGGAIKGNRVDIACWTHQEALEKGVDHFEVFYVAPEED